MNQHSTTSADGTTIAYSIHGDSDATTILWVHGATMYRDLHPVPAAFAQTTGLRVIEYDRRGRGGSSDTSPYAIEREIEDIAAVIAELGGQVDALLGESSGALLALEAARAGVTAASVVAYEPPVLVDDSKPPLPADYVARLDAAAQAGDPAEGFRIFLTEAVGLPPEMAAGITMAPNWDQLAAIAHTIRYDGRIAENLSRGDRNALERYAGITAPVLVAAGSDTFPFILAGAEALVDVLPSARFALLPGGTHQTDPALLGPVVLDFLGRAS